MNYLDQLRQETNRNTLTENGAVTNDSSLNPVLDFFSMAGAMRSRPDDAVKLFKKAFASDPLLATKCLFYIRDVRGGQGERDIFRKCVKALPEEVQTKVVGYVPEYGRYDDLLSFTTPEVAKLIKAQLALDVEKMKAKQPVSLLAKWLPSENASSRETFKQAITLRKALKMKASVYRKTLSGLRNYIRILETSMSKNDWEGIDYETLPSQAHRKHVKAFNKHDGERYTKYIESVEKGEKKIKTGTLFTYEIFDMVAKGDTKTANAMWDKLPDYTRGENALVVADVSGSMSGRPMSISVSLALYFAEHNKGAFHNYFMTFSAHPQLVQVLGKNLENKLQLIENSQWDMNTDIEKAFKAILSSAVKANAPQEEMPKILYIISDMEFDACTENSELTNFENAKEMFEQAGYKLPTVVFWNVDSRQNQAPATMFDNNVTLISGSSQSTFRYAVEGKNPLQSMLDILNSERYSKITI